MRQLLACIFFIASITCLYSQIPSLSYYFNENIEFDQSITPPSEFLGHEIGELHVSHDKLVFYLRHLAHQSNRISIETIGFTHEKRPLILLTISSPENLSQLPYIKETRRRILFENQEAGGMMDLPIVIWMGYSIHGNEPSGSNAALLMTYYLAAAKGNFIDSLLSSSIILIDPCSNPDGLQRFSTWVNSTKSKHLIGDVNNLEYEEPWPQGRTNHYWFDLNRDWLLLEQPESRARIKKYHEWKPNILTDHHEMGIQSTLFFQPGVSTRKHPLIPEDNQGLTEKLSGYHIKGLDSLRELFYSKENFDDFYLGKGSTYPDVNGGIGILFEQGSTRGLLRETENGLRNFPSTIKNQLTVSFSTLKGAIDLKPDIQDFQINFFRKSNERAKTDPIKAYIVGDSRDKEKIHLLAEKLNAHDIELFRPERKVVIGKAEFDPSSSFVIPLDQPQYALIKALFDKRKTFEDSLFYDVSAWSFDLAFNVDFTALNSKELANIRLNKMSNKAPKNDSQVVRSDYGYALPWEPYYSPAALFQLLNRGVKMKVATQQFSVQSNTPFSFGTLIIPGGLQKLDKNEVHFLLDSLATKYHIQVYPLSSSSNSKGIDIGSDQFKTINLPSFALVVGEGTSPTESGEIWHLLDSKMNIPVTLLPAKKISTANLAAYSTIIFPDGAYAGTGNGENLKNWLKNGGVIIAQNEALLWLKNHGIFLGNFKPLESQGIANIPYAQRTNYKGAQSLGGAIFNTKIDISHPLCFGFRKNELPVFKNSLVWLDQAFLSFNNPIIFSDDPLLSGYISEKNLNNLKSTSAVTVHSFGNGKVIGFAFNPNFRGYWYGTEKLFFNALFFGQIIETQL